ncbi:hypothetical protein FB451DRAFT_1374069 [Mycena latifolia]|nr:hypothetical protein FB451DRAFT_1374069 [Mycena latifolia]
MARLLCLVLAALAASLVAGQTLASCGSSDYDPTQYTCYDGDFLCPILNGDVYQKCGDDCYSTTEYSCFNGDFLCPTRTQLCGETCYDPDKYNCANGQLFTCVGHFGDAEVCNSQGCSQLGCCAGLFVVANHCRSPCDFEAC